MTTAQPTPSTYPYEEISLPTYTTEFIASGITHEELPGGGVTLYGRCPRCRAEIKADLPTGTIMTVVPPPTAGPAPTGPRPSALPAPHTTEPDKVVPIVCACEACEHSGRPTKYLDGCGAYWLLTVDQERQ